MLNSEELKQKIIELIAQADGNLDIFISVVNTETREGECYGFGCQGCHSNQIVELAQRGFYKHSHEMIRTH